VYNTVRFSFSGRDKLFMEIVNGKRDNEKTVSWVHKRRGSCGFRMQEHDDAGT
jgi:hypothetical protein